MFPNIFMKIDKKHTLYDIITAYKKVSKRKYKDPMWYDTVISHRSARTNKL